MSLTPGPWTLAPPSDQQGEDDVELYARPVYGPPDDAQPPFQPSSPVLAVVVGDDDARLIAAAPDLLAACEMALEDLRAGPGPSRQVRVRTAAVLRAAVDKARS